jgi:NADH:ubiquinone oxidoreductase subunit K
VLALFVIGVEAAELGVALAVILAWHRHRGRLDADGAALKAIVSRFVRF